MNLTTGGVEHVACLKEEAALPLVVDLDGTLTPCDTLLESLLILLRRDPVQLVRCALRLRRGRAAFKEAVAGRVNLPVHLLPFREDLLEYLIDQKRLGRKLVLATAAHRSIAERVAGHLRIFDLVIASTDTNLKGGEKLRAIQGAVGAQFAYAGNDEADLPIWAEAQAAVLVGVSRDVATSAREKCPVEIEFPGPRMDVKSWLKALRVYQWAKNLLIFVPLLTSFSLFDPNAVGLTLAAFFSFSLLASANYVFNDLLDIQSDRMHPSKRHRPFANGRLDPIRGAAVAAGCAWVSMSMAFLVGSGFALAMLGYLFCTNAYSLHLKRYILIDVIVLSLLYTLRIVAGGLAIGVTISHWLLAFSGFIFLSLALIKRCAELLLLDREGKPAPAGRDYRPDDLKILFPVGVCAGLNSVVVFGLYITAADTQARYANPGLLWFAAIGLTYWITRLWIKTSRGEMHDDPLVFAVRDFGCHSTVLAIAVIAVIAHSVPLT
ncbi:UbiA family prenyltransferase [Aromatoleum evansii]|uniref:UbiA family prenyltransferase n=1 Tax=Aromatoleum evansii TaxID=59406 RepID=UPI00145C8491|nr:UbiA family prenyltransferase [Aromatoleum evansii]NMG28290.1 UbiA family prenyltransferase [Aromatoleum evansii]